MTIPVERTMAVLGLAKEVERLIPYLHGKGESVRVPRETIRILCAYLRHYPSTFDMEITADKIPELWGQPCNVEKCKKCGGAMKPGKAIEQTWTGTPDFYGDARAVTMSPGGMGKLIDCMKCEDCGWSITSDEA